MRNTYQICKKCIMDTTDPDIEFDEKGICNHCRHYEEVANKTFISSQEREKKLQLIVNEIKEYGKNKKYDSIIGLSGGADSSFAAFNAKKLGLRPLAVHVDNGWNSEISVKNIENIVQKLNFDLYTHMIDWEEFKDLQLSFIKSGVVDIEMLTDHAIEAFMFKMAKEKRIRYIISGRNNATESIMPGSWSYSKWDSRNIKAIHKRFGHKKINKIPIYGFFGKIEARLKFTPVSLLNYIDYNKQNAMRILQKELDWQDYGGKHYESIFTKFYQCYILPRKFNIDKRKGHLSALICSGQITREQALKEMKKPICSSEEFQEEKAYVIKKLGLSNKEFEEILKLPVKSHLDYPNGQWVNNQLLRIKKVLKTIKSFSRLKKMDTP